LTNALWSIAGYIIGALVMAVPLVGLWLFTRTRGWQRRHRLRWAGSEMPLLWWRGAERDLPPELLDPPDTGRQRRSRLS
jgi:hypothetical protein